MVKVQTLEQEKQQIRRMSELLRSGATMMSQVCPVCNTPLFRVKGQLLCPRCNKNVVVVKEGEEETTVASISVFGDLENTVLNKLIEIDNAIKATKDVDRAKELANALSIWLDALERLKRIQRISNPQASGS
jgi:UPF0148 protein